MILLFRFFVFFFLFTFGLYSNPEDPEEKTNHVNERELLYEQFKDAHECRGNPEMLPTEDIPDGPYESHLERIKDK